MKKTSRTKKTNLQSNPESISDVLSAYKIPTIILTLGLLIAVLLFQWSLRQELAKSEKAFYEIAAQIHQTTSLAVRRHIQIMDAMGRIFGQIQRLSEEEFNDIAEVFASSMNYNNFYFFDFTYDINTGGDGNTPNIDDEKIKAYFSKNDDLPILNMDGLQEIIRAMKDAHETESISVSQPYKMKSAIEGEKPHDVAAVVTPVQIGSKKNLYLVGILDIGAIFKEKLEPSEMDVNMRVIDIMDEEESIFFDSWADRKDEIYKTFDSLDINYMNFRGNFNWGNGINWQIIITPSFQSQISTIGMIPWVIFISALIITAMLSFIVFRITTESLKAQVLVEEQTHDLRKYADRLEISNRDLDDFAYVASHDLKEPLRGLYNYAEILEEDYGDKLDAAGAEKLAALKKLAKRMEGFVESLFNYSKLSRIDFTAQKVDMQEVVQDAIDMLGMWLKEQNAEVKLITEFPDSQCDPVQACEVFRNLITNGVKYNKNKNKIIEIGCTQNSSEKSNIPVYWVKDNGIGIADEHKGSIFKIFKRLHERDEYGGGTGAGLTIVWKIIQRHGGRIWLESKIDEGTIFYFTLMRKDYDTQ